ncbi:MAG TPA: hypothetical protein VFD17_06935 [Clostridia bacterium]|nr:hypothetical protein [Clostridia bacterium]
MKKLFVVFLVMVLVVSMAVGCRRDTAPDNIPPDGKGGNAGDGLPQDRDIVKMGLGSITSINDSTEAEGDKGPRAQVDTTTAAVAFDKNDKVVKVTIDTAQTGVEFDTSGKLVTDKEGEFRTKTELGFDYNMKRASDIDKEWFEQIAELEKWMEGKTVNEIKAMKVKERDLSHTHVPDEPELTSTVTITVGDYLEAVERAHRNSVAVSAGAGALGLGHEISIGSSEPAKEDKGPVAQVDTTMAATLFDRDGRVVKTIIDTAQTNVEYDTKGKLVTDKEGQFKTKVELGNDYNMKRVSDIGKEWFEQIAELEKWIEGKTVDEIRAMRVKERDPSHTHVPDEPELTSTVTITVQDYVAAVAKSQKNAK